MLTNPLVATYNAVATNLDLRGFPKNGKSTYSGVIAATSEPIRATVQHSSEDAVGAQHFIRLDVDNVVAGQVTRTNSVWLVMKTTIGLQDSAEMTKAVNAFITLLNGTNIADLINGEY